MKQTKLFDLLFVCGNISEMLAQAVPMPLAQSLKRTKAHLPQYAGGTFTIVFNNSNYIPKKK